MVDGRPEESESALRALRSASPEIEALRSGSLAPSAARVHILRVAIAVDRSLRRLLRDDEGVDLSIRLKALAADELRIDGVLSELRRRDRLPMELAAAVHELSGVRRRLEGGDVDPEPGEAARAVSVADGLEEAIRRVAAARPAATAPIPPNATIAASPADVDDDGAEPYLERRGVPVWAFAAGAVVLALIIASVLFFRRGPSEMDLGIALFDRGEYAEAAQHFYRYSLEHTDDETPHLFLARIHRRMNRPELAAEAIREAQQRAPEDAAVHRELGFLLLDTGQASVAVQRFRAAVQLEPESSEGWVGLIRALRESGNPQEVDAVLAQAPAEVRALLTRPGGP